MTTPRLFVRGFGAILIALTMVLFLLHVGTSETPEPLPGTPGRTLVDQAGQTLHLSEPVQRIGTPGISMASLILAIGGGDSLQAVAPEVRDNPWLQRLLPASSDLPTPFTRPAGVNLEELLRVRPDLVTLWVGNEPLGKRLEAVGIPVLYLGYANPEEMKTAARLLGQALGPAASARAETFVRYYDDNLRRVAERLADLPESARPKVYYASISPLQTEGRDSMIDAWIGAAGGINLAARAGLSRDVQVHLEDVLAWNPDLIVTLDATQQQAILTDPRWQDIRAVQQGRVLVSPRGINAWCTRAAETSLQILWAARVFHPERFADLDIGAETRRFYQRFYGYALNDEELARILSGAAPLGLTAATPARPLQH
ncbi:ABC transporter substrate-binding protein [Thiobaca trueperi]|uniref:Iron complex transport system substrate-binding protein n=1 Tax=Thiobaca trueperi TaxID=127458 RepID=A0A4R3N5E2_9GAMM|nr:ABC transporter substrate-binding protein [Thiobaca trueperi]TCT24255.1 iron complex transport system substrate-binding protein [Thiobaca trueperi]